jgi:hypothetical protein
LSQIRKFPTPSHSWTIIEMNDFFISVCFNEQGLGTIGDVTFGKT